MLFTVAFLFFAFEVKRHQSSEHFLPSSPILPSSLGSGGPCSVAQVTAAPPPLCCPGGLKGPPPAPPPPGRTGCQIWTRGFQRRPKEKGQSSAPLCREVLCSLHLLGIPRLPTPVMDDEAPTSVTNPPDAQEPSGRERMRVLRDGPSAGSTEGPASLPPTLSGSGG